MKIKLLDNSIVINIGEYAISVWTGRSGGIYFEVNGCRFRIQWGADDIQRFLSDVINSENTEVLRILSSFRNLGPNKRFDYLYVLSRGYGALGPEGLYRELRKNAHFKSKKCIGFMVGDFWVFMGSTKGIKYVIYAVRENPCSVYMYSNYYRVDVLCTFADTVRNGVNFIYRNFLNVTHEKNIDGELYDTAEYWEAPVLRNVASIIALARTLDIK